MRVCRHCAHEGCGGVDLGLPNLAARVVRGAVRPGRVDTLYKIPTDVWLRYLAWYRGVLDIPVRNGAAGLRPENGLIAWSGSNGRRARSGPEPRVRDWH